MFGDAFVVIILVVVIVVVLHAMDKRASSDPKNRDNVKSYEDKH